MDVVGGVISLCWIEWFRSAEMLCKGERCLGHRRESVLCFLYKIYHKVYYPINEYPVHFIATSNTNSASTALGGFDLDITRC